MSRLTAFLTALWLSSASAQPALFTPISQAVTGVKNHVTNEVQAVFEPVAETLAFNGGGIRKHVKPIAGVAYKNYDEEPDMSKLTPIFMNRGLAKWMPPMSMFAQALLNKVKSEMQVGLDPVEKALASIGGAVCNIVKLLVEVPYGNFSKELDMSELTLVFMNSAKPVIYNLSAAAEEIPKESWFNPELPLKIYMHGFTENPRSKSAQTISNAFFAQEASKGKVHILALDSSSQISRSMFLYLDASIMVRFIGKKLGKTLAALIPAGLDPKNIHLIGHSLGSHIAGFTGKTFSSLTGSRVGRISGLDPASPCFYNVDPTVRLSKEDADFVDVIHTDAGVFGLDQPVGHVDHYPNGGSEQPGCLFQTCSHSRAWELYAESVLTPEGFTVVKCNSKRRVQAWTVVMGYGTPTNTRGTYYCQTRGEKPYAAGAEGLKYKDTSLMSMAFNAVNDFFNTIYKHWL